MCKFNENPYTSQFGSRSATGTPSRVTESRGTASYSRRIYGKKEKEKRKNCLHRTRSWNKAKRHSTRRHKEALTIKGDVTGEMERRHKHNTRHYASVPQQESGRPFAKSKTHSRRTTAYQSSNTWLACAAWSHKGNHLARLSQKETFISTQSTETGTVKNNK